MLRKLFLYLALATLTQCSKCKDDPRPRDPAAELPPATQTGANTFGCLVNGQAYTPQGNNGTANYVVLYDGNVNILTYRFPKSGSSSGKQTITIAAGPVKQTGAYSLDLPVKVGTASFSNRAKAAPCDEYIYGSTTYSKGKLVISRLDLQAQVISGTFEFALAKPGCDTIRVTDGRFDYKL